MKIDNVLETIAYIYSRWQKQKLTLVIALIVSLHLIIPPAVYAVTSVTLNRTSTWAVSILGVVILALIIYLFTVIFQPERF